MKATFKAAYPYQTDKMNLPVGDLEKAIPFYERKNLRFSGFIKTNGSVEVGNSRKRRNSNRTGGKWRRSGTGRMLFRGG